MRTIYKYRLNTNPQDLMPPKDACILKVQTQLNIPYMWMEVDTEKPVELRRFMVYETGEEIKEEHAKYIDTYQTDNFYMYHVYEMYIYKAVGFDPGPADSKATML